MTKTQAKRTLEHLIRHGFDGSSLRSEGSSHSCRVRCSRCEALVINGIACHEQGCSNTKRFNDEEDSDE